MSYAVSDQQALDGHIKAVHEWVSLFSKDPVNRAVGAVDFLKNDMVDMSRIRWFSVADPVMLSGIWKRYMEPEGVEGEAAECVRDFYYGGVAFMSMHNSMADQVSKSFYAHLARSIVWPNRSHVIPSDVKDYSSNYEDFYNAVSSNPWVVFMIILSFSRPSFE